MINTPGKLPESKGFPPSLNCKASAQLGNELVQVVVSNPSSKSWVVRAINTLFLYLFLVLMLFLLYAATIHPEIFSNKDWAPLFAGVVRGRLQGLVESGGSPLGKVYNEVYRLLWGLLPPKEIPLPWEPPIYKVDNTWWGFVFYPYNLLWKTLHQAWQSTLTRIDLEVVERLAQDQSLATPTFIPLFHKVWNLTAGLLLGKVGKAQNLMGEGSKLWVGRRMALPLCQGLTHIDEMQSQLSELNSAIDPTLMVVLLIGVYLLLSKPILSLLSSLLGWARVGLNSLADRVFGQVLHATGKGIELIPLWAALVPSAGRRKPLEKVEGGRLDRLLVKAMSSVDVFYYVINRLIGIGFIPLSVRLGARLLQHSILKDQILKEVEGLLCELLFNYNSFLVPLGNRENLPYIFGLVTAKAGTIWNAFWSTAWQVPACKGMASILLLVASVALSVCLMDLADLIAGLGPAAAGAATSSGAAAGDRRGEG